MIRIIFLFLFCTSVVFAENCPLHIIVDYRKPITENRMFTYDCHDVVVHSGRVSHGSGSGIDLIPHHFSNTFNSHASSDGLMIIAEKYEGKHGTEFRIKGLEKKNSNVYERRIELHRAEYMNGSRYNWSWGCFAVSDQDMDWYLKHLKYGTRIEVIP